MSMLGRSVLSAHPARLGFPEDSHRPEVPSALTLDRKRARVYKPPLAVQPADTQAQMGRPTFQKGDVDRQGFRIQSGAILACRLKDRRQFLREHFPGLIEAPAE